jgi:hypothetical protein
LHNVRVFDGDGLLESGTVVIDGTVIGSGPPSGPDQVAHASSVIAYRMAVESGADGRDRVGPGQDRAVTPGSCCRGRGPGELCS